MSSQFVMIGLAGLAFLIALWLVIVIVRMLTGGRLRFSSGRTRQARLGIVDAFDLDRQRQLIIVRRDNTEHLIMIGGPNDLVIESEIVRIEAREARRPERGEGGDVRIPANVLVADDMPAAEEPLLPMPLPETRPQIQPIPVALDPGAEPMAPRGPTFPLPPRRPMPERRPPPPPPSVTRVDEPAPPLSVSPQSMSPLPVPVVAPAQIPAPMPVPPEPPAPPVDLAVPTPDPASRPLPRPAPFLKPLPPRPPLRPLRRATPTTAPGEAGEAAPPPVIAAPPPVEPPPAPMPAPSPEPPASAKSQDALESLEEEMAKLLGRG